MAAFKEGIGVEAEKIEFVGSLGHTLSARLHEPNGGSAGAYALFAHCFTCSKDILAATRIARGVSERGIGVLRFDFTGLGQSEGEFAQTTFSSNVGDLLAAADWLRQNRSAPALLVGHSLGGAAVLFSASKIAACKAVATIGAPAEPEHVMRLIGPAASSIEETGQAEVSIGGRPFMLGKALLDDLREQDARNVIGSLRRALMIFHSPVDTIVGIDHAAQIFGWAKHPKSFVSLGSADHLLSKPEDAAFVSDMLAAWAGRAMA